MEYLEQRVQALEERNRRVEGENPQALGLETVTIPGGKYARTKIENWEDHTDLISPSFDKMASEHEIDSSRPSIEFYRSQKELILQTPSNIQRIHNMRLLYLAAQQRN